jgi:hypothetical protein
MIEITKSWAERLFELSRDLRSELEGKETRIPIELISPIYQLIGFSESIGSYLKQEIKDN